MPWPLFSNGQLQHKSQSSILCKNALYCVVIIDLLIESHKVASSNLCKYNNPYDYGYTTFEKFLMPKVYSLPLMF